MKDIAKIIDKIEFEDSNTNGRFAADHREIVLEVYDLAKKKYPYNEFIHLDNVFLYGYLMGKKAASLKLLEGVPEFRDLEDIGHDLKVIAIIIDGLAALDEMHNDNPVSEALIHTTITLCGISEKVKNLANLAFASRENNNFEEQQ